MSGERRLGLVGLCALIVVCSIFVLASGACGEEEVQDPTTVLLDEANECIYTDDSDDINLTVRITTSNSGNMLRQRGEMSFSRVEEYDTIVRVSLNSTVKNYREDAPVETKGFIVSTSYVWVTHNVNFAKFQTEVTLDLLKDQSSDGSWNANVGDTAMAVYGLTTAEDLYSDAVIKGVTWLQEQENLQEHSWGSIEYDSKAIMALASADIDVWDEIAALVLKQKPDGSFGGIEDTSWAVMALSTNPNKETMKSMEKAVQWLRSQDYDNNEDLAMAALAEQSYENARLEVKEEETGFIPPPWMYALSFFIVGSFVFSYWLFARLDRNEPLEGVRKDIYGYITEHPGEHLASITKKFDISSSSARYHLSVLEGMDKIVSHKNGKYRRYYINKNGYSKYTNGNGYKPVMSALKNGTARKIVKFLISNPGSNQKRVSNALKIHPSTVNWHANRLREAEILSKHKKGKEIVYSLNKDVQLRKVIGIIEGSIA